MSSVWRAATGRHLTARRPPRRAARDPAGGPPRKVEPAVRARILRLFVPYRRRLGVVIGLIVLSAGLSALSPFLLRAVLDRAIPRHDTTLLTALVLGMIGIAIASGVLGVAQTWLSNVVGQRVMHDLRTTVYRHLQRMSLAFFTRTRTGDVQSRLANDIGGIDTVVTSTATSIASNATTVIATVVAMVLLDWRLAAASLITLPFFVWLTRRVGAGAPARSPPSARAACLTCPRWSRSRCRSRASCSARRWAARSTSAGASRPSPSVSPTSKSGRRWPAAGGWRR